MAATMSQDGVASGTRSGSPRFLVVGCGGIGGLVAAHLFASGHDVTALTTNAKIAGAINTSGFRVVGEGTSLVVSGRAVEKLAPNTAPFDYILLATQPPQVEEAARGVLDYLSPRGAMVTFQNGLCEERIAMIAGPERTLGGVVAWGASMAEPGVYERTSPGGFVLGRIDGAHDERLEPLARALGSIGETIVSQNLAGARWSKLAINCAITSIGALGGDRLGVLLRHRFIRRLALEVMTEVVLTARASGVRLEKVSGTLDLDWIALTDAERQAVGSPGLFAKHAILLAVGTRFRKMRSSMLAAIERGRPPAVDFLNGEITARGARFGIPTPINAAIQAEVHALASRKRTPSLDLCHALYDRTRELVSAPFSMPPPPAEADPAALDPDPTLLAPPPRASHRANSSPPSLGL
jgi:2-dehydropantoate 2-reductase